MSGTLEIIGQPTQSFDDADLAKLRDATIGFVFPLHHLLPASIALESVTPAHAKPNAARYSRAACPIPLH